jgi:hypothetical protein
MERFKDAAGAYTCAPCYKKSRQPAPSPKPPAPFESGPIPLVDEDPAWLRDIKPQTLENCPKCQALKTPGVTACLQCGHDTAPPKPREVRVKRKQPRDKRLKNPDRVNGDPTPLFSDAFIGISLIVGVISVVIGIVVYSQSHDPGKSVATAGGAFVLISVRWWIRSSIRNWFS